MKVLILLLFLSSAAFAATERDYQKAFCDQVGGFMEVRLPDNTRIDCLTDEFAIEIEYSHKWAEAIGQSLYYSILSKKKPGIALVMKLKEDERFYQRLELVAKEHKIRLWRIYEGFLGTVPYRYGDPK